VHPGLSESTIQRICAEFIEMPGLRLTARQAQRLWGLDERTCLQSLAFLVEKGFLARVGDQAYARPTDRPAPGLNVRMAKALTTQARAALRSARQQAS
jgi:hypothetical protein